MSIRSLITVAVLGTITITASTLSAQTADSSAAAPAAAKKSAWDLRMVEGDVIPTGRQRDVIKRGKLNAAQLTWMVQPSLGLTATTGWARSSDLTAADEPTLDVFTYDVGAEVRGGRWNDGGNVSLRPFVGIGAGGRSYNYRNLDVDATHNLSAYGSAGGDIGVKRVQVRIEVRDYISGFKPLTGVGAADTRNDVALMVGVRIAKP